MAADESQCCLQRQQVAMKVPDEPQRAVAAAGYVDCPVMGKAPVCVEQHWRCRIVKKDFHTLDDTSNPSPDIATAGKSPKGRPIQIVDFDQGREGTKRSLNIRICFGHA